MSVESPGTAARQSPTRPRTLATPRQRFAVHCATLPPAYVNSVCGALAGVASGIVTCPLDVIKTRLQAQGSFRPQDVVRNPPSGEQLYRGLVGTARVIWREDGLRGMYRGLGPMLLGYLPTWAVYMGVYETSKEYYYSKMENKWIARINASITAGACSTMATNPIWVIKTRLMAQVGDKASKDSRTPWHYRSTLDAAKKMWNAEGFRVFYSGLAPALLGLTHVAIQFPLYEYFKMMFTGLEMGQSAQTDEQMHLVGILAATFLSKVCATSATYPHEVLRTRLQTQQRTWSNRGTEKVDLNSGKFRGRAHGTASSDGMLTHGPRYRGIIGACRTILREEGWRAFYSGMGTNMVRAVPAAMTTMLTFETLKKGFTNLQREGDAMIAEETASYAR